MTDTRDITERLRSRAWEDRWHRKYREEAAAEIERLRQELADEKEYVRNLQSALGIKVDD